MAWTARVAESGVCLTRVNIQEGQNRVGGPGVAGSPGLCHVTHMCVTLHVSPYILRSRFISALHVRNGVIRHREVVGPEATVAPSSLGLGWVP